MTDKIKMVARQSITASASPTGKALGRGDSYDTDAVTAKSHERRQLGDRAPVKADTGKAPAAKPASVKSLD